ncbi:MAG: fatty acid desaturase [Myxococcota bacterium]
MTFEPTSPLPASEPPYRGLGRYGTQNLVVCGLQAVAWALLLTAIDRAPGLWKLVPLFAFCTVMQGVFTMMHEYFHRNAHRDPWLNHGIGVVGATLFGTSATLHKVNHWGHHIRNRTSAERGEFIHPGESAIGKVFLYYFATMGGLWIGGLVFPFVSWFLPFRAVERLRAHGEFNTYAAAFEQFDAAEWNRMRAEAVVLAGFWGLVLAFGPWSWGTLALAYAAFAYHWSVLQWIYHLRTPIHVIEGAYNLRIPTPMRVLWLNFNCNLTHHRRPDLPWQELYRHTNLEETRPLWFQYLLMWLPPRRFPDDLSSLEKTYF